jgi:hypothetical protein
MDEKRLSQWIFLKALGLSRLAGKIFDGQRWVAYEAHGASQIPGVGRFQKSRCW